MVDSTAVANERIGPVRRSIYQCGSNYDFESLANWVSSLVPYVDTLLGLLSFMARTNVYAQQTSNTMMYSLRTLRRKLRGLEALLRCTLMLYLISTDVSKM